MNFDEWYRQSPTRLCGPSTEDIERGRKLREAAHGEDKHYELGNGNYLRVDPVGGIAIYNDDNIVCLNDRQTFVLKAVLLSTQQETGEKP